MLALSLLEPAWEIAPSLAFQNKQPLKAGKKRENYNFFIRWPVYSHISKYNTNRSGRNRSGWDQVL